MTSDIQPLRVVESRPEQVLGVTPAVQDGERLSASMPIRPFLAGPGGRVGAGCLGVLIDNVIGYAVMLRRPPDMWSVTTEMTLDMARPVPGYGEVVVTGGLDHSGEHGAIASGRVVDADGNLIAVCRQHGRFVPGLPAATLPTDVADRPSPADRPGATLVDLLDGRVDIGDGRAELTMPVGPDACNPMGNMHGGVTLSAVQIAGASAIQTVSPELKTASVHVYYVRGIAGGTTMRFRARLLHPGRSFAVAGVEGRDADDRVCALGTVTAGLRDGDEIVTT